MGKHREPEQPEENGASQYPASGEEGGVGKQGMGRGKLIAIIAATVVVALVLLQVVLYLARDDEDEAGSAPETVASESAPRVREALERPEGRRRGPTPSFSTARRVPRRYPATPGPPLCRSDIRRRVGCSLSSE